MLDKFRKYAKFRSLMKEEEKKKINGGEKELCFQESAERKIDKKLDVNIKILKDVLGKSDDIIFREICIGKERIIRALICYIDGWLDKALSDENMVKPLITGMNLTGDEELTEKNVYENIKNRVLTGSDFTEVQTLDEAINGIMLGSTVLFIDGCQRAIMGGTNCGKSRAIEEPATEVNVRGPRDGFNESLRVNTSLLRRRIKSPDFIIEDFKIGRKTQTQVSIAYMEGIAEDSVVEEVRKRLKKIDVDAILESGYIEQFIEDSPMSPFSLVGNSEKPDKVAAKILEGRVAILCEGTPFVLTVPKLFVENFQVSEDYYSRPYLASALRMLRLMAYFITMFVPALYVALETYHQEMIPTVLLVTMAGAREGIPFPSFIETLIMIGMFELLRESGIRLPRQVGQAVSIVGALVIGESAVQAGIISAPMVIIGAITGLTSFMISSLIDTVVIFRLFFIILASVCGLYGIVVGQIIMLTHACSLRSFGVPYMSPLAPLNLMGLRDSFVRLPLWTMDKRPRALAGKDSKRQAPFQKPGNSGKLKKSEESKNFGVSGEKGEDKDDA